MRFMQCFVNRHKETQSKRTGMAVNVKGLRICKFPDVVGDIWSYHLYKFVYIWNIVQCIINKISK